MERDYKIETAKELYIKTGLDKIRHYSINWIRRVNRKPRNKFASLMKSYAKKKEHRRDFWVL